MPNHHQHDEARGQGCTPHPAKGPLDRIILGHFHIHNHFIAYIGNGLPQAIHIYFPRQRDHCLARGEINGGLFHSLNPAQGPLNAGGTACTGHPPDGEGHLHRSFLLHLVAGIGHRGLEGVFIDHPGIIIHISLFRSEINLGILDPWKLPQGLGQPAGAACAAHAFDVEGDALSFFHMQTSFQYAPAIPLPCRGICSFSILLSQRPVNNYCRRALRRTFPRQGKSLCMDRLGRALGQLEAQGR